MLAALCGCSSSKLIPDDSYLLSSVKLRSDDKAVSASQLESYVRQRPNAKWFSLLKIPLATYCLAGKDTTKWINRTLHKIGEEPVVYDSISALRTTEDLRTALQNMGYIHADVVTLKETKGHKINLVYLLHPGDSYNISNMNYEIADPQIDSLLKVYDQSAPLYKTGERFSVNGLDDLRKRFTAYLLNNGYYKFNKDYISFNVDTMRNSRDVDVTMKIAPFRSTDSLQSTLHPRYTMRNITYSGLTDSRLRLRTSQLNLNTAMKSGKPFSADDLQRTYNNFARLQSVGYTNIRFTEHPDSFFLDSDIQLGLNKRHAISFQPEGTNTAGNLGAAALLTYENRNLFHGSEVLSIQLRAAFEAITGLEGYQNEDYEEYNVESKLSFPRMVAPLLSTDFKRNSRATSELSLSYNLQNRPEFHRRVFSAAWRYRWTSQSRHSSFRIDALDLNYVLMPWISATFKHDYLDSVSNRNAILRYNYEDLFIMKVGAGYSYSKGPHALKTNFELAGNLLDAASRLLSASKNSNGQYTIFNIAYAQYIKGDIDYSHHFEFDENNTLVLHCALGIAYPYGNSTILPFEKRYFSGGANSVRGWSVRELGPGKFKGTDGRIDFINQTGDLKIDLNAEYRTYLFWKFNGAAFIDAGNIWTIREYDEQPGGKFKLTEWYKQLAVAYGLGLRLNFDYFILRFDMGMKAVNPSYDNTRHHYPILHHNFGRDFSFHFAVGMPF